MRHEITIITEDGTLATILPDCSCNLCRPFHHLYEDDEAAAEMARRVDAYRNNLAAAREADREADRERAQALYAERQAQEKARIAAMEAGRLKAKELFLSMLTQEEREQFERDGYLYFVSQTGKRFRLVEGYSGNVSDSMRTYCCYIDQYYSNKQTSYPHWDHMVAQLVNLRWNEKYFLETAY